MVRAALMARLFIAEDVVDLLAQVPQQVASSDVGSIGETEAGVHHSALVGDGRGRLVQGARQMHRDIADLRRQSDAGQQRRLSP